MSKKSTISVFGAKPKDAILVPEMPMAVRNNCQNGQWTIGDRDYGSKCSMTILKFCKFYGDLGQTQNTLWGQVWFIAESGELPQGVVLVTYIKGRSLNDLNCLITSVQARGVEPATGIFVPEFVKHSGQKPDDNGVVKPINYYSLKWDWVERTDWSIIDQAAVVLSEPNNCSRMIDLEGTKLMVQLDNLSASQIALIIGGHGSPHQLNQAVSETVALPAGN